MIVVYHPRFDRISIAESAYELYVRMDTGWIVLGEL